MDFRKQRELALFDRTMALLESSNRFVESECLDLAASLARYPKARRLILALEGEARRAASLAIIAKAALLLRNPIPEQFDEEYPNPSLQPFGEGKVDSNVIDFVINMRAEEAPNADAPALSWPKLERLRFSERELDQRRLGIGASDANVIFSGDTENIRRLWLEKRGLSEPEDLSGHLAVQLGCWTEVFNRQWFEKITGQKVIQSGSSLICSSNAWRRCTLDGLVEESGAIWEAKHTNAFAKPDEVLERYMPQLQHAMAVARVERAVLSVIFGNHKYEIIEIASDWVYQAELFDAELAFWTCVRTGREPVAAAVPATPRPIGTREICLEGNNAWASAAADWIANREAAKVHGRACSAIKELVEEDVGRAFGHGIEAKRSKSGAITIRELS